MVTVLTGTERELVSYAGKGRRLQGRISQYMPVESFGPLPWMSLLLLLKEECEGLSAEYPSVDLGALFDKLDSLTEGELSRLIPW
jgi:hypothetical protein